MNKLLIGSCLLFMLGCSAHTEYEYIEVYIPVKAPIEKPSRPQYTHTDTPITYLPKVLNYTRLLEVKIDTHNGNIDDTKY